jgi:protein O-mannosyl-transferase
VAVDNSEAFHMMCCPPNNCCSFRFLSAYQCENQKKCGSNNFGDSHRRAGIKEQNPNTKYAFNYGAGVENDRDLQAMKKNSREKKEKPGKSISRYFILVVAAAAFIVYAKTIAYGFVFDDVQNILDNPVIYNFRPGQLLQIFAEPWRAIPQISYGLTHYLFGFNPVVFHLSNVLIHAVNSVLVFAICRLLAKRWVPPDKVEVFAFFAGMIFAVHPLHSEAVAYVWGRSSSVCGLFYFASLLMMLIGFSSEGRRKILWFGCALIAGLLAWKTKEEAITLPFIAACLALLIGSWRAALTIVSLPLVLVIAQWRAVLQLRTVVAENRPLVSAGFEQALNPLAYFLTSIKGVVCYYLKLWVLPIGQCADAYIKPVSGFGDFSFLLSTAVLAGLVALGYAMRSHRMLVFGLAALLISPLTSYSVMPLADVVAEHRIYISGLGVAIIASWLLLRLTQRRHMLWVGLATVLVLGFVTLQRIEVWANSVTIWKDAVEKSPQLARPHMNLGMAYQAAGNDDLAMVEYGQALRINSKLAPAYVNMAGLFFNRNDFDNSEIALRKAIGLSPSLATPYLNLAQIEMKKRNPGEALAILNKAPESGDAYLFRLTRGDVYAQLGRYQDAITDYDEALRLRPDLIQVADLVRARLDWLKKIGAIR